MDKADLHTLKTVGIIAAVFVGIIIFALLW